MAKEVNKENNKKEKKDSKKFFKEFKAELKRVSWPTKKQLVNNTIAVVTSVIIVAAIVFVLDLCFENVNKFGVEKLKAIVTSSSSEESNTDGIEYIDTTTENTTVEENSAEENVVEENTTVEPTADENTTDANVTSAQ